MSYTPIGYSRHSGVDVALPVQALISIRSTNFAAKNAMPHVDSLVVVQPDNTPDVEIRQLKLTIAALRQALEESSTAREELSRTTQAGHENEISQLRSIIAVLRAQLEQLEQTSHAADARAKADAANEIAQLQQA